MHRRLVTALLLVAGGAGGLPVATLAAKADLTTEAERSGDTRTGRYAEVQKLCPAYQQAFPGRVRCFTFGTTPEGRPMLALAASADGVLTPEAAAARKRPVVLIQGGIHAGEIDGKDAGFRALRDLLEGKVQPGVLKQVTVVFVPVFNADGHERFGAWNRPNQRGPEAMGWRTTALNLNLNRDYAKADTPEMQAMIGLLRAWDPPLYVDLHVTDGADFRHDISIQVEPTMDGAAPAVLALGNTLQSGTIDHLNAKGALALPFYPSFVHDDDPASGFEMGIAPPRFSTGYWSTFGRFGMLVETHSWKDYKTRVRLTYETVLSVVAQTARDGAKWNAAFRAEDARSLAGQPVDLAWGPGDRVTMIDFQGYAYTRTPSAVSGTLATHYDPSTPAVWRVPLRDSVKPTLTVTAPKGGYVIPAAWAARLAPRLAVHGITVQRLSKGFDALPVEAFRATEVKWASAPFEGRVPVTVQGAWGKESRALAPGALYVPIAQPRARLVMALLEPQAPDSYVSWGDFNAVFEQKEYMEAYVAEQVAVGMLKDPAVAQAFNERLAKDAAFAASPAARLAFFARRHPSWDERYRLYPVLRVDARP